MRTGGADGDTMGFPSREWGVGPMGGDRLLAHHRDMDQLLDTPPAPETDPTRRTSATWMAATGAFLLVAAAAVFVAVRWDQIPEALKLALLGAITGSAIVAGRTLRATLPATAGVLVHLGVFLVPVVGAAAALRLDLDWPVVLLADSLLAVGVFGWFAHLERSVVLRAATAGAVVAAALGLAAVASVPASLTLALVAAALLGVTAMQRDEESMVRRAQNHALVFATTAAVLPIVGLALAPVVRLGPITDSLMLTGGIHWALASTSGGLTAVVVGAIARAQRAHWPLAIALVALVAHGASMWESLAWSSRELVVAAAASFVLIELGALFARRDAFFGPIARAGAFGSELLAAAVGSATAAAWILAAILSPTTGSIPGDGVVVGTSLALIALGFGVARFRRADLEVDLLVAIVAPLTAIGSVAAFVPEDRWAVAAACGVAAGLGLLPRRAALALWIVPGALFLAPLGATGRGWAAIGAALYLVGVAVVHRGRGVAAGFVVSTALVLPVVSVVTLDAMLVSGGYALGVLALAYGLERWSRPLAWTSRIAVALPILVTAVLAGQQHYDRAWWLALVVTAATGVEAYRLRHPAWSTIPGVGLVAVLALGLLHVGVDLPIVGVALVGLAAVAGAATCIGERWTRPATFAAAVTAGYAGSMLSMTDPHALAVSAVIAGVGIIAIALLVRTPGLAPVGATFVIAGLWGETALRGITASEAYVTPVAVALVALGVWARHRRPELSSWVAYGPAVGLALTAGLVERLAGGGGGHAVYVGAVAVAAVIAGATLRLAAPLLLGTIAIGVLTGRETLDVTAGVPTWGWLALGGAVLLGSGIALERTGTSPVDAGRRLVDVVSERYG